MKKILHFIWFGSCLPLQYQLNILSFQTFNPTYKIKLWIDPKALSPVDKSAMDTFSSLNSIPLCNIRDSVLLNQDLIIEELDSAEADRKENARLHFVRASDLARIAILYDEGGIYLDTDTTCIATIPQDIQLKQGFLSQTTGINELNFAENPDVLLEAIYYHFMVAEPHNQILELTAAISRVDYASYHASRHRQWESSLDRQTLMEGTVKLTGTALRWAFNYLLSNKQLVLESLDDIFLDAGVFSHSQFDKSWLQDFQPNPASVEQGSLDAFCNEIERNRQLTYPLKIKKSHDYLDYAAFLSPRSRLDSFTFTQNTSAFTLQTPLVNLSSYDYDLHFKPLKPVEFHFELPPINIKSEFELLKTIIHEVSEAYTTHSLTFCRFSFFHPHHSTGRQRVADWVKSLDKLTELGPLQQAVMRYLANNRNGNTYPHSFRNMLATTWCKSLQLSTNGQFNDCLEALKLRLTPKCQSEIQPCNGITLESPPGA